MVNRYMKYSNQKSIRDHYGKMIQRCLYYNPKTRKFYVKVKGKYESVGKDGTGKYWFNHKVKL